MTAVSVHILAVAGDGEAVATAVAAAGHSVSGPVVVEASKVPGAIAGLTGVQVAIVVGVGSELFRATMEGGVAVFRLATEPAAVALALERLVLPGLSLWAPVDEVKLDAPIAFQTAQRKPLGVAVSQDAPNAPVEDSEGTDPGWRRAVEVLEGELTIGRAEELPQPIETLSPVINVLDTAGERGVMKLPNGRRYGIYGWPDLRRASSKVIAVGWGDPLAEVLALHRHPHRVGTVIIGDGGTIPREEIAEIATRLTGRRPPSDSGVLFAVSGDAVWILRGSRVVKWDGTRERDEGSPKQVLASLVLHWSNR